MVTRPNSPSGKDSFGCCVSSVEDVWLDEAVSSEALDKLVSSEELLWMEEDAEVLCSLLALGLDGNKEQLVKANNAAK